MTVRAIEIWRGKVVNGAPRPEPTSEDYAAFEASILVIDTRPPPVATCDEIGLCDDPYCVSCRVLDWLSR